MRKALFVTILLLIGSMSFAEKRTVKTDNEKIALLLEYDTKAELMADLHYKTLEPYYQGLIDIPDQELFRGWRWINFKGPLKKGDPVIMIYHYVGQGKYEVYIITV